MNIEWKQYRIGEVADVTSSKRIFLSDYVIEGIPFYRSKEVIEKFNGNEISLELFIKSEQYENIKRKFGVPQKDDILLTSVGTIGVPYKVKQNEVFYFKDGNLTWIRKYKKEIDPAFLFQWIRSEIGQKTIQQNLIGSSQSALTIADIKKLKIQLPPLPTQQRIASILSAYDDLIEVNNQRIKLLEETAREFYKEWFVRMRFPGYKQAKFVKGVPEGWEVKKVKDIVDRRKFGKTYKPEELSERGNVIVIDQSTDALLGFHNNNPDHIATSDWPMMIFGDHTCKMQLMIESFSLAENVIPIAANDKMPIYYLYYLIESLVETTEYKRHWNDLVTKSVFVCQPELQIKYAGIVKPFFEQIEILKKQNTQLRQIRDRLLPRLISGKLEVKEVIKAN